MGIIKTMKGNALGADARRAREAGRQRFAAILNAPARNKDGFSGGIDDWAEMIQAIENEGWTLTHWTVGRDTHGRPEAYPLFQLGHHVDEAH